jgi:hypothetical protein
MKRLLGIVGPSEFKNTIQSILKKELSGCIEANAELESVLGEVYRTSPDTFKGPVQITEADMRIFFLKMVRGVHSVRSGPTLDTFPQLLDFYKHKVSEQKFGKNWFIESLKSQLEELSTGVYLVCGLTKEETIKAKELLEDSFLIVEIIPELPKPKRGELRQRAEVHKDTDITITHKKTEDGTKREISKLLQKIKTKQKEKNVSNKPKFRIAQRQFRPWDA